MKSRHTNHFVRPGPRTRRGAIAVKVAIVLPVLIGFLGLVIDSSLLMARQRAAQNAADASALAAAMRMLRGANQSLGTTSAAVADANQFLLTYNLPDADPLVLGQSIFIPPDTGPYAGNPSFVEVVITAPSDTIFMQILGSDASQTVTGRAVAGFEYVAAGEGSIVLDPTARPGLDVGGNGRLRVDGRVLVNSQGGGKDEEGGTVSNDGVAASAGKNGIIANDIRVVGGVDDPSKFLHFDGAESGSPLHCRQLPIPDPFAYLPTPTTATGVTNEYRGSVSVTTNKVTSGTGSGVTVDADGTAVLPPGIYQSISINGGKARFEPGIFVMEGELKVTGGDVVGDGVMFYITGHTSSEPAYDPATGLPDINDPPDPYGLAPPGKSNGTFASVSLTSSVKLTPIDTTQYSYANAGIDIYNGMLFYQRRKSTVETSITGNAADGLLKGTIYAKWANFKISGQGTYGAQFVVGSMTVFGNGDVTINYDGEKLGKAPAVFLVE